VPAQVAQPRRAQQRIGDGVGQHVGVGVSRETPGMVEPHTAQDQRPSRHEGMHVEASTDPNLHPFILIGAASVARAEAARGRFRARPARKAMPLEPLAGCRNAASNPLAPARGLHDTLSVQRKAAAFQA
jgi:hypothetical protein